MGPRTALLVGLAQDLDAAGIAAWSPEAGYPADAVALTLGLVPPTPDRLVTLSGYGVSDDPVLADTTTGVQVRTRWAGPDPTGVDDLADLVFDRWQAAGPLTLPTGVRVVQMHRQSTTSLGQDAQGRWSRSDNYYVDHYQPATHRL